MVLARRIGQVAEIGFGSGPIADLPARVLLAGEIAGTNSIFGRLQRRIRIEAFDDLREGRRVFPPSLPRVVGHVGDRPNDVIHDRNVRHPR